MDRSKDKPRKQKRDSQAQYVRVVKETVGIAPFWKLIETQKDDFGRNWIQLKP